MSHGDNEQNSLETDSPRDGPSKTSGRPTTPTRGNELNEEENSPPAQDGSDTKANGSLHRPRQASGSTVQDSPSSHIQRKRASTASSGGGGVAGFSEWSHQQLTLQNEIEEEPEEDDTWQEMPAYAPYDIYDDDGKIIAKESTEEYGGAPPGYSEVGGGPKGYTKVQMDEDAQSATSMDDNTAYLFKDPTTNLDQDDEDARDVLGQMQATKDLLTENQRIAYVGVVRLAMAEMAKDFSLIERTKGTKKQVDLATEALKLWSQKMMVRLYSHMELSTAEQMMIEQLAEHGLQPGDLTPSLKQNSHVQNPMAEKHVSPSTSSPPPDTVQQESNEKDTGANSGSDAEPPPYSEQDTAHAPGEVQTPSQLPKTDKIDIDLRWTVLCDLFLILIADSIYDSRSRVLLEKVGSFLDVSWLDICRFEKRVTEALEMEEEANKEDWQEAEHMESRRRRAKKRRLVVMGLATVGGGLVIGLSAGLLAPLIGAGLAAGFTTIGVTGTSGFLAGAGGAAIIGTGGVVTGSTIGVRAANRRTGAVKTFEYRPLYNNKRVNLVVTIAGWMNGKVDDVRLPFSTVDPIMGDMYSILWEPEMLRSMGDTINILATEALTQGLQQLLGSTILITLMAALQAPILLAKLSYLIDNPWSNSLARADMAGLILADSLVDRNLGARPITLVGFSLGSRVIFTALQELAKRGAVGLIQNVYVFGSPVVVRPDEYWRARTVVSGRFVNGYTTNDWILGYLFRATSGGIRHVAGLAQVNVAGIENIDVTEFVPGHMAYRASMPKLLRHVGWAVESDEFTEIEDPDPDNHEARQRELINEIEEARKDIREKGEKKRFGFWGKSKKSLLKKKEWETYDDQVKTDTGQDTVATASSTTAVLFDVEAIKREVAAIAAEGMEVKELESTMPPIKLDSSAVSTPSNICTTGPSFRGTKSEERLPVPTPNSDGLNHSKSLDYGSREDDTDHKDVETTMTFEPNESQLNSSSKDSPTVLDGDFTKSSEDLKYQESYRSGHETPSSIAEKAHSPRSSEHPDEQITNTSQSTAQSDTRLNFDRNVWADDDEDFGQEKEVSMTFE